MNFYALLLKNGIGVQANVEEAAKYYKQAADKGNKDAMLNYAHLLEKGEGVPQDLDEARRYCEMAKK